MDRSCLTLILFLISLQGEAFFNASDYQKISNQFKQQTQIWVIPSHWNEKTFYKYSDELVVTERFRLPTDSTGDIAKALRESQESVLVCFDKSAADCLETLRIYPYLRSKVSQLVSVNGKVYGTEMAQNIEDEFSDISYEEARKLPIMVAIKYFYQKYLVWRYPNRYFLVNMTPSARQSYFVRYSWEFSEINKQVPILWLDRSPFKYGTLSFGQALELP